MLTSNVNLKDRPVNDLVGKVMAFKFIGSDIKVIYVKFNDRLYMIVLQVKKVGYLLGIFLH